MGPRERRGVRADLRRHLPRSRGAEPAGRQRTAATAGCVGHDRKNPIEIGSSWWCRCPFENPVHHPGVANGAAAGLIPTSGKSINAWTRPGSSLDPAAKPTRNGYHWPSYNEENKGSAVEIDALDALHDPHYEGHPSVLVRWSLVGVDQLTELLTDAWRVRAPNGSARPPGPDLAGRAERPPVGVERAVGLHEPDDRPDEDEDAGEIPQPGQPGDGWLLPAPGVEPRPRWT